MTRSSILDDTSLGLRGRQIAAEEWTPMVEACDCASDIDAKGRAVKRHVWPCRHAAASYDYGCGLRPAGA